MKDIDGVKIWGDPVDAGALKQILTCARTADRCALMADHHQGYAVPIGGVVAYSDRVSPSGVGFDIGCGNKAVLTDVLGAQIRPRIKTIMDDLWDQIAFGIGRKNSAPVDHDLFDSEAWKLDALKDLKGLAASQLGTVGSGNHYVDIFVDESDRVWVGCHFGSRGLGHKAATWFLKKAEAKDSIDAEPLVLDVSGNLGAEYLECMKLAGEYAYAGRDWVCNQVVAILGASVLDEVHNHHNFAWREQHDGSDYWVVRKGATPAFPGQRGFVGGSMGDISVILEGVDSAEAKLGLYSTVHGAGRVMSRTEAAGKFRWKNGERVRVKAGAITEEMLRAWIEPLGVELRGAGLDESPHCYKRLPEVLDHHAKSIRILHTLTPIGVAMAGETEIDPYKD